MYHPHQSQLEKPLVPDDGRRCLRPAAINPAANAGRYLLPSAVVFYEDSHNQKLPFESYVVFL